MPGLPVAGRQSGRRAGRIAGEFQAVGAAGGDQVLPRLRHVGQQCLHSGDGDMDIAVDGAGGHLGAVFAGVVQHLGHRDTPSP